MPATLYRIKLYGHSGGDTDLFCKNLATILDVDPEKARALLLDSPAIIKEGIEKEKAEEFCKLLEPIRALCIVEPVDGEISDDALPATIGPSTLAASQEADDLKKEAGFRSWIWMGVLGAAIGALLLFAGGAFMSSFWSLYRHNRPPAASSEASVGSRAPEAEPQSSDAGQLSFEELQSQTDELEEQIKSNRFKLAEVEKARDMLHRSARTSNRDLEQSALTIRDLKDRIRRDVAQLQVLKRRLEEIAGKNE